MDKKSLTNATCVLYDLSKGGEPEKVTTTETVASLGTALTESHVDLIRRYAGEMVLVFDSAKAGIDAADRALRVAELRGGDPARSLALAV